MCRRVQAAVRRWHSLGGAREQGDQPVGGRGGMGAGGGRGVGRADRGGRAAECKRLFAAGGAPPPPRGGVAHSWRCIRCVACSGSPGPAQDPPLRQLTQGWSWSDPRRAALRVDGERRRKMAGEGSVTAVPFRVVRHAGRPAHGLKKRPCAYISGRGRAAAAGYAAGRRRAGKFLACSGDDEQGPQQPPHLGAEPLASHVARHLGWLCWLRAVAGRGALPWRATGAALGALELWKICQGGG